MPTVETYIISRRCAHKPSTQNTAQKENEEQCSAKRQTKLVLNKFAKTAVPNGHYKKTEKRRRLD
jgi:hypothetical protein